MAKETRSKPKGNQPITRHPLFPATVGLWFGALFGIGSLVIRPTLLESVVTALGLDAIVPAMAPPLGATARILLAVTLATIGGIIGARMARMIAGTGRPRRTPGSLGSVFGAKTEAAAPRRRKLAIEDQPAAQNYGEHAPLPGARPQVFDVAEFDLEGFEAEMTANESERTQSTSKVGDQHRNMETEAEATDCFAGTVKPDGFDEPAIADNPAPFAAPQADPEPAMAQGSDFVAPESEPAYSDDEEQQWPGVRKPMAFEVEEIEAEVPTPDLPRFDLHSDGRSHSTNMFGDEPARPLFAAPREMAPAPQPAQAPETAQPAAAAPFASPSAPAQQAVEPAYGPDFAAKPAEPSTPAPFAEPSEHPVSQTGGHQVGPLGLDPEPQEAPAPQAAPFAMPQDGTQRVTQAQPAPFDAPMRSGQPEADQETSQPAIPEAFSPTTPEPSEANAAHSQFEESKLSSAEEQAQTPIVQQTAAQRISHADADELSNVELLERLALALERRKGGNKAVSGKPNQPAQAQSAEPEAQSAAIQPASDSETAFAPELPQIPAALRPVAFDEDEIDDDALAEFLPARRMGMTAPAQLDAQDVPTDEKGDEEKSDRNPFAGAQISGPEQGMPAFEDDDPAETDEDRALEDGYSSLLSLSRPDAGKGNGFVRIDEPEPTGEVEPMVVFPNQAAPAAAPFARPDSAATGKPFDGPPASNRETSTAVQAPVAPMTTDPAGPPPFAPPAQAGETQPAKPPFANPATQTDPDEAERALRSALANLQRMSGAA